MVPSSSQSSSPPTGTPRASEVTATPGAGQPVGEVVGGGLAVDGGGQGQDHLAHLAAAHAADQLADAQGVGTDAVQRREQAAQHVVAAAEGAGPLHGPEGADLLDHADQARRRGSRSAQIEQGSRVSSAPQIEQERTRPPASASACGQRVQQLVAPLQQGQGRAPGRARPQPRQLGQQRDQPLDLGSGGGGQAQNSFGMPGMFIPAMRAGGLAHQLARCSASSLRLASAWAATIRSAEDLALAGRQQAVVDGRRRSARRRPSGSTVTRPPPDGALDGGLGQSAPGRPAASAASPGPASSCAPRSFIGLRSCDPGCSWRRSASSKSSGLRRRQARRRRRLAARRRRRSDLAHADDLGAGEGLHHRQDEGVGLDLGADLGAARASRAPRRSRPRRRPGRRSARAGRSIPSAAPTAAAARLAGAPGAGSKSMAPGRKLIGRT